MEQLVLKHDGEEIRIVKYYNKFHAVANEVAKLMGYKNPRGAIVAHCRRVDYKIASIKTGKQNIDLYIMNERAIGDLLKNTKLEIEEDVLYFIELVLLPSLLILNGDLAELEKNIQYIDTIKAVNECLESRYMDLWERYEKLDKLYQNNLKEFRELELESLHLSNEVKRLEDSKCPLCNLFNTFKKVNL